jgi:hypothetical protein
MFLGALAVIMGMVAFGCGHDDVKEVAEFALAAIAIVIGNWPPKI